MQTNPKNINWNQRMELNNLVIILPLPYWSLFWRWFFVYVIFSSKKTIIRTERKNMRFEKELTTSQDWNKERTLNLHQSELHGRSWSKTFSSKIKAENRLISKINAVEEAYPGVGRLLGECIQDIRNLSKTLITEQVIHFGLVNLWSVRFWKSEAETFGCEIISQKHDIISRKMVLSFSNSGKHQQYSWNIQRGKKVEITIDETPSILSITISDSGKGLILHHRKWRFGTKNMQLRKNHSGRLFPSVLSGKRNTDNHNLS